MKRDGSPIGNQGYTLIEILLTMMILLMSVVVIFPAFFRSADILKHLATRYYANVILNNLFVSAEDYLRDHDDLSQWTSQGAVSVADVTFHYQTATDAVESITDLYQLTVQIKWDEIRKKELNETAYVF